MLIVPDVEAPKGKEKMNLKQLHEMLKDTNSHGLVSLEFLCALGIFFGVDKSIEKEKNKMMNVTLRLRQKMIFSSGLINLRKNW